MPYFDNAFALVIGINNYQHVSPLRKAVRDARDVYSVLIDPAFCGYRQENVRLLLDNAATREVFRSTMKWLGEQTDANSTVTIFFSGHGAQASQGSTDGNYMLLYDSNPWSKGRLDVQQLAKSSVSNREFTAALNEISSQKLTVIFDACHSGGFADPRNPFFDRACLRRGFSELYYDTLRAGRGRVIIASCMPDQVSWEKRDETNGLFTAELLLGLRGEASTPDQGVHVFGLFQYLSKEVPRKAASIIDQTTGISAQQNPYLKAELVDDYVIALSPRRPVAAAIQVEESEYYDIFISYSHDDEAAVGALAERLRQDGYRIWLDENELAGGDELVNVIAEGIERSSHIMVCLSENYLKSKWGDFEGVVGQTLSITDRRRKLIPIKIGECDKPTKYKGLYIPNLSSPSRWEQEYLKAVKKIKPRTQEVTPRESSAESRIQLRQEPLGDQRDAKAQETAPKFKVRFRNRQTELDLIEQQLVDPEENKKPYVYVAAPALMGKSFLLRELCNRCSEGKFKPAPELKISSDPLKWRRAFVDLAERPHCGSSAEALIIAITEALGDESGSSIEDFAERLQKCREQSERALILVDGAECLTEEMAGFLPKLLMELEQGYIRSSVYRPGFVVASRRAFQAWKPASSPLRRIGLTPFTEDIIATILEEAVKDRNLNYDDGWYRDRADEIMKRSAGHPGCIVEIVEYFHSKRFAVPNLNTDEIFVKCVLPIIENQIMTEQNLTGSTPRADLDRLGRILMELSTCRLFTLSHIGVVTRRLGLKLTLEEMRVLEKEIRGSLLVEVDPDWGWLYIPYSIRGLLGRMLDLQQGDAAARHREFAASYDAWLNNSEQSIARDPILGRHRVIYICEALFHHVLSHICTGRALTEFLKNRLIEYIGQLRSADSGQSEETMREILINQMFRDNELHDLVELYGTKGAYQTLLAAVNDQTGH